MKHLLFGEDTYRAEQFIKTLITHPTKKETIADESQFKIALSQMSQTNLFAEPTVYIFKNCIKLIKKNTQPFLKENQTIVIWETTPKLPNVKELRSHYKITEFKLLKNHEVQRWLQNYCKDQKIEISTTHLKKLVQLHGSNLHILTNEIEKLRLYSKREAITDDLFYQLSGTKTSQNIFDLLDAIGSKHPKLIQLNYELIASDPNMDEWYIFHLLVKQIRQITKVKYQAPLKVHPFVRGKLTEQSQNWTAIELENSLNSLLESELATKQGKSNLKPLLTNWVHSIY